VGRGPGVNRCQGAGRGAGFWPRGRKEKGGEGERRRKGKEKKKGEKKERRKGKREERKEKEEKKRKGGKIEKEKEEMGEEISENLEKLIGKLGKGFCGNFSDFRASARFSRWR
jgi:hypothetical protein